MAELNVSIVMRLIDNVTAPMRRVTQALSGAGRFMGSTGMASQLPGARGALAQISAATQRLRGAGAGLGSDMARVNTAASRATGEVAKLAAIGGVGLFAFKREFIDTAAQFEMFSTQLEALEGSSEGARRAMAWVTQFATKTPGDVAGVMDAFVRLRAFGLDPMDGTLQAIVDQTSKLGFSQEKLEGISLALGQAWTKQKLQGEEILQLLERGVPVWDLLSRATGKSVAELNAASSAGRLGRKEIQLLIREIGKSSAGAAARAQNTWAGMVSNLGDQWDQFKLRVMEAGLFDWLRTELGALLKRIDEMAASGELDALAKRVGTAIKDAAVAVRDAGVTIAGAVERIGGVGNALKLLGIIVAAKPLLAFGELGLSIGRVGVSAARTVPDVLALTSGIAKLGLNIRSLPSAFARFERSADGLGYVETRWGKLMSAFSTGGRGALALVTNPVFLIIVGIALLAAGVVVLVRNWDKVLGVWERFKQASLGVKLAILAIMAPLLPIIGPMLVIAGAARWIIDNWTPIGDFFKGLWEGVVATVKWAVNAALGLLRPLIDNPVFEFLTSPARSIAGAVGDYFAGMGRGAANVARGVADVFTGPDAGASPAEQAARGVEVGGAIDIHVTAEGQAIVKKLKAHGGIDLDVDAGLAMAGAL